MPTVTINTCGGPCPAGSVPGAGNHVILSLTWSSHHTILWEGFLSKDPLATGEKLSKLFEQTKYES